MHNEETRRYIFYRGMKDAIPIGLGYLAVGFTVGIACRNAGLNAFEGFWISFLNNASAGEYAGLTVIAAQASLWEIALITLVANARYLLMGCALSQRLSPELPLYHRLLIGYDVTDELFGIAIAQPGMIRPEYYYGAMLVSLPMWSVGTVLGVLAGNVLPLRIVSALSVALFGMFLAVIIPPSRKNKVVAGCVMISFAMSLGASHLPYISTLSGGTRTIILTVIISAAAALLFPVRQEGAEGDSDA